MATIVSGTGSTFTGNKLESEIWQAIHHIQNGERLLVDVAERFDSSKDDTFNLSGNFSLPGALTWDTETAKFTETAALYLPTLAFTPGNPTGTFKAVTLSQYFIDLIKYAVMKQNAQATTPAGLKNITLEFDYNNLVYTGTFKLPYASILTTDGGVIEKATEWIVT